MLSKPNDLIWRKSKIAHNPQPAFMGATAPTMSSDGVHSSCFLPTQASQALCHFSSTLWVDVFVWCSPCQMFSSRHPHAQSCIPFGFTYQGGLPWPSCIITTPTPLSLPCLNTFLWQFSLLYVLYLLVLFINQNSY